LSSRQQVEFQKYKERQQYKMNDSIRTQLSDGNRKSTRFIKYRVCCNIKGLEKHAILQLNNEKLANALCEGMQVKIECVNINNRFGEETLSVVKRTKIDKIELQNNKSVSSNLTNSRKFHKNVIIIS